MSRLKRVKVSRLAREFVVLRQHEGLSGVALANRPSLILMFLALPQEFVAIVLQLR